MGRSRGEGVGVGVGVNRAGKDCIMMVGCVIMMMRRILYDWVGNGLFGLINPRTVPLEQ